MVLLAEVLTKDQNPGPHEDHKSLSPKVGKKLVPIFQRLSEKDLLRRSAHSKTHIPNESFNNLTWKICPKTTFVSRRTIVTVVPLAACQFSMGSSSPEFCARYLFKLLGSTLRDMSLLT